MLQRIKCLFGGHVPDEEISSQESSKCWNDCITSIRTCKFCKASEYKLLGRDNWHTEYGLREFYQSWEYRKIRIRKEVDHRIEVDNLEWQLEAQNKILNKERLKAEIRSELLRMRDGEAVK